MSYYVTLHEMNIDVPKRKVKKMLEEIDEALKGHGWTVTGPKKNILSAIGFDVEPVIEPSTKKDENGKTVPSWEPSKTQMTIIANGNWDGRWFDDIETALQIIAKYAEDDGFMYLMGEDGNLFGYQIYDHKLFDLVGDITWKIAPWCKEEG